MADKVSPRLPLTSWEVMSSGIERNLGIWAHPFIFSCLPPLLFDSNLEGAFGIFTIEADLGQDQKAAG